MSRSKPYSAPIDPGPHVVSEPLAQARRQLLDLAPGGTRGRPFEVATAAVIEPKAEATRCPRCSDHFAVEEHEAPFGQGVREVKVFCRCWGERRSLWSRTNALP